MDKFGRNFVLTIEKADGGELTITLPFTTQIDITRNTLTSANVCQIRIYNLSLLNRNQIRVNQSDYGVRRAIVLRAGYGDNMPRIFKGNISQAWSVREGQNFITQIECFDGGFAYNNAYTNTSFPASTPNKAVVQSLSLSLPGISKGVTGEVPGVLTRGATYSGPTMNLLGEITGGAAFIDDEKINVLGTNEYIGSNAPTFVVSSASGLLGTPVLEQTIVRFDMIFEPQLQVGHKILLDSITGLNFNGEYKVIGVKHRGMISGTVGGTMITTGEFFYSKLLTGVYT